MDEDGPHDDSVSTLRSSRHRHLIEHIQDAVVEFEFESGTPVIMDVNNSFVNTFGHERTAAVGESLNELVVPEWNTTEAQNFDQMVLSGEITYQRVKRKTTTGLREFLYRGVPYSAEMEANGGFAVYTDLTELNWNQQRFQVMNRILRHNLRNKINIIDGYVSNHLEQAKDADLEDAESADALIRAVEDLEQLIEEAHAVRTIIAESESEITAVDAVSLIQGAVNTHRRSFPSATIETKLPDSLPLRATSNLQFAIESLIENAIEHNPATSPYVRIRAEYDASDEWAHLYVEDDGPIIPPMEKEVIAGTTEISPTNHGTGLGLWLVKWATEIFGGELLFEESEFGGNSVYLRLASA